MSSFSALTSAITSIAGSPAANSAAARLAWAAFASGDGGRLSLITAGSSCTQQLGRSRAERGIQANETDRPARRIHDGQAIAPLPPHLGERPVEAIVLVQRRHAAAQCRAHRLVRFEHEDYPLEEILRGEHSRDPTATRP